MSPDTQRSSAVTLFSHVWKHPRIRCSALVLLALAVYIPAFGAGFIWDDDVFLTENPVIRMRDGLIRIWRGAETMDYFPLTLSTLWMEWRLWGKNPAGYHLINILLHAAAVVLWWRVLMRLNVPGAWLAAAIFAVHPVNVASVAWITERKNTLSMLFMVLTLLFYLRFESGSRWRWYGAAWGMFLLALLSKTSVVMLPCVLLGFAWWQRGRINRRDVCLSIPFFAASAALGLVTVFFQYQKAIGEIAVRPEGIASRLAGAGLAAWFYLYKAMLPLQLSMVYPRWHIDGSSLVSFVPDLLWLVWLGVTLVYRKSWGRPVLFGIGYFLTTLFPVLGFFTMAFMGYSFVADHWAHVSLMGIIALVGGAMGFVWDRSEGTQRGYVAALSIGILATLSALTWRQTTLYRDHCELWKDTISKNLRCWVGYLNLGNEFDKQGKTEAAKLAYIRAFRINPYYGAAHANLATILAREGRIEEAIAQYAKALELQPNLAEVHNNFGVLLETQGKTEEAIHHYAEAVRLKPNYAQAHHNLAMALAAQGRDTEAVHHYTAAIHARPDYPEAHNNLGNILLRQGRKREAEAHYKLALRYKPDYAEAHNNLGTLLAQEGDVNGAMRAFQMALKIAPTYAEAHINLGHTLAAQRRMEEAVLHYAEAVRLKPDSAQGHYELAETLLRLGRADEAISHYREALRLKSDRPEALNNLAWILATHPDPRVRNGAEAVQLAEAACALTGHKNPVVLNTLAAAYAEMGDFKSAIETVKKALEMMPPNSHLAKDMEGLLKLYSSGRPFHQAGTRP